MPLPSGGGEEFFSGTEVDEFLYLFKRMVTVMYERFRPGMGMQKGAIDEF
jgi:hypothetical protein